MKKILCVGSVTADVIVSPADSIPPPGTLRAVQSITMHVGGCASNAAIDLAKLGIPAALCCKLGTDSFGDFVLKTVRESGVEVSGVLRDASVGTTVSMVCVDSKGERSFLYEPGSTARFRAAEIPERLAEESGIVFVAGAMLLTDFDGVPAAEFLRRCRSNGKCTAMDTAWDFDDVWLPKIEAALPELDWFLPSYEEAARLTGETEPARIARRFRELGAKNVAIKLGADGAYFQEADGTEYTLPTYRNIRPVDTTGAGDSFCAGFLAGMAQGWEPKECGRFANAVGTHCIQKIGASTGIPPMGEVLEFMQKYEGELK